MTARTPCPHQADEAAEQRVRVALSTHAGLTDSADWRCVALGLAARYAPELLNDDVTIAPAKKSGRPTKWNETRLWLLSGFIEMVKNASRDGIIRFKDIDTNKAACRVIVGDYPETAWMRKVLDLKAGTSASTLENKLSMSKAQADRAA